jgi:hypothetical protein
MAVDVYDAINAFKASHTGRGHVGTAVERRRARAIVRKLWELWGDDEIGFDDLDNLFGDSHEWGLFRDDIRVDLGSTGNNVAGVSVTIVHEAVHLLEDRSYIDEELLCRTMQLHYYHELLPPGIPYQDRRGRRKRAILHGGTARESSLRSQAELADRNQLVDYIINIREYADSLDADWVAANGRGWDGLSRRWASTKGNFLRVLGDGNTSATANARLIVEILESVTQTQWHEVIRSAGGEGEIRNAVRYAVYSPDFLPRLQRVQARPGAPVIVED